MGSEMCIRDRSGYTFGFYSLMAGGVLLFLIAPLIQKLMHGVK